MGEDISEDIFQFGKMHKKIFAISNIPKFRSFQYRLLQRSLVTNKLLTKWSVINDPSCSFCHTHDESVKHLLYDCSCVQEVWNSFAKYVLEQFSIHVNISWKNVVCNKVSSRNHVANFLCLICKQVIYKHKCLKMPIHFRAVVNTISGIRNLEKYFATKNQKLSQHHVKWGEYS